MKKIFLFFLFSLPLFAQDVDSVVVWNIFYRDTLTASIDTIDIRFGSSERFDAYTLTAYSTGIDTIDVYTRSLDMETWVYKTEFIIDTEPVEYGIDDPQPNKIRLITTDHSANCVFILSGKVGDILDYGDPDSSRVYLATVDSLNLASIKINTDSTLVNVKESNTIIEQIETEILLIGIDTDSTLTNTKEGNTLLEQIETEELLIGIDVDSTLTNVKETNYLAQHIDDNTDLVETKLDSIDNQQSMIHAELIKKMSQTTGDSLEVNTEEINYLLQVLRTTLANQAGSDTLNLGLNDIINNQKNGTQKTNIVEGSVTVDVDDGASYNGLYVRLTDGTNVGSLSGTGDLEVSGDAGVALATSAGIDSLESNLEESNYLAQHVDTNTDGLEAKADSTLENVKESNTLLQTIRTATTSILYGQTEIVNQLLDDAPTLYTSTGVEIGNKNKVSFVLTYNETEVGNTVSGAVTLEVSPDNSNWYALNAFYNNAGTIVPTVNYTADATDTFHLPEFVTYPYIRATFTGTNTDADDTIQINITLCWQGE